MESSSDDFQVLLTRVLAGDKEAEVELFQHRLVMASLVPLIRGFLETPVIRCDTEMADCLQIVYLKAMKGIRSFRGEYDWPSFISWMRAIASNALRDVYRRVTTDDVRTDGYAQIAGDTFCGVGEPIVESVDNIDNSEIQDALKSLLSPQREIVIFRHFSDMSIREIAMTVGLSERQVQSELEKAHATLAKKLRDYGPGREGGC